MPRSRHLLHGRRHCLANKISLRCLFRRFGHASRQFLDASSADTSAVSLPHRQVSFFMRPPGIYAHALALASSIDSISRIISLTHAQHAFSRVILAPDDDVAFLTLRLTCC